MDENKFAELSAMLAKKMHQIQRALQVLQSAQRWHPEEYSRMEERELGDWIAIDDVVKAIQILEGQP